MVVMIVVFVGEIVIIVSVNTLIGLMRGCHARKRALREVIFGCADLAGSHGAEDSCSTRDQTLGVGSSAFGTSSWSVGLREGASFLEDMSAVGTLEFIGWHMTRLMLT
jgi:hypothetical protein